MIDDGKREEVVKVRLTDRELLDLSRLAAIEDRKLADMAHYLIRVALYGRMSARGAAMEGPDRASEDR